MVPAMIYLLRMPTNVVIGTSMFQIIFITAVVTVLHATLQPHARRRARAPAHRRRRHRRPVRRRGRAETAGRAAAGRCSRVMVLAVALRLLFDLVLKPSELLQPRALTGGRLMRTALSLAALLLAWRSARPKRSSAAGARPARRSAVGHLHARDLHPVELHRHRDPDLRQHRLQPDRDARQGHLRRHHRHSRAEAGRSSPGGRSGWPASGSTAPARSFLRVPGFYAVLSTRPFRAITSDETLKTLGIGLANLDFGRVGQDDPDEETFRSAVIRLKEKQQSVPGARRRRRLSSAAACSGRASTCRSTSRSAATPPTSICSATASSSSKNQSTLEVNKAGFEQLDLSARVQPSASSTGCSRS